MRILYVTQWYEPEPAFKGASFAQELAARGHMVDVLTGFPNYPGGKVYAPYRLRLFQKEQRDGLDVYRVFLYPSHDRSSIGRVLNYASFFLSTLIFGLIFGRRYDVVYVYHPPITPSLAAALFCKVWHRPFLLDVQDLWPDSVFASGMLPKRAEIILNAICRFVYRSASGVVGQSDAMTASLITRGSSASTTRRIYNWATYRPASIKDRPIERIANAMAGKFNIVYGGNLGQAQALDVLIDAALLAAVEVPDLRLHLIGGGIDATMLRKKVEAVTTKNVIIHDPVSRAEMDRIFDLADVLILHLKNDPLYEITIPSKVQHYLACGKPIIAGLCGEAASILRAAKAGWVCAPMDVSELAAAMVAARQQTAAQLSAMGSSGRAYYDAHMSFECAIRQTVTAIEFAIEAHIQGERS